MLEFSMEMTTAIHPLHGPALITVLAKSYKRSYSNKLVF